VRRVTTEAAHKRLRLLFHGVYDDGEPPRLVFPRGLFPVALAAPASRARDEEREAALAVPGNNLPRRFTAGLL
jgi:hypothetical protein